MTEPSKQIYLQPDNRIEYGEVVKVGDHCYIKTDYDIGTRTHYVTGGTGEGHQTLLNNPGTCSCELSALSGQVTPDDTSHVADDDKIYLNPSDQVTRGDQIMFQDRCYTKTGNTGTMTHVLTGDAGDYVVPTFETATPIGSHPTLGQSGPVFSESDIGLMSDVIEHGPHACVISNTTGDKTDYIFKFDLADFDDPNITTWHTGTGWSWSEWKSKNWWDYYYNQNAGGGYNTQFFNGATSFDNTPRCYMYEMDGDTAIRRFPVLKVSTTSDGHVYPATVFSAGGNSGSPTFWRTRNWKLELVY